MTTDENHIANSDDARSAVATLRLPDDPGSGASGIPIWQSLSWRGSVLAILAVWMPFLLVAELVSAPAPDGVPSLILLITSLTWNSFLTCHLLANGRWWAWLLPSLLPPLLLAAVPIAALAGGMAAGGPAAPSVIALASAALLVMLPQSGINFWALLPARSRRDTGFPIRVIAWNTWYWHQYEDNPAGFYAYLRGLDADIYLLQEYCYHTGGGRFRLLNDDEQLFSAFPEYNIIVKGQLVTLSRLPVTGTPIIQGEALRVDIGIGRGDAVTGWGAILSTYNVHIPVQVPLTSPLRRSFYADVRERAQERDTSFATLFGDIVSNRNPMLVAGDLNTSPAIADAWRLKRVLADGIRASSSIYPASWDAKRRFPRFWRLDWAFVSSGVHVHDYEFIDPAGHSDHCVQRLRVSVDR